MIQLKHKKAAFSRTRSYCAGPAAMCRPRLEVLICRLRLALSEILIAWLSYQPFGQGECNLSFFLSFKSCVGRSFMTRCTWSINAELCNTCSYYAGAAALLQLEVEAEDLGRNTDPCDGLQCRPKVPLRQCPYHYSRGVAEISRERNRISSPHMGPSVMRTGSRKAWRI
jgi:hypothetical protein